MDNYIKGNAINTYVYQVGKFVYLKIMNCELRSRSTVSACTVNLMYCKTTY